MESVLSFAGETVTSGAALATLSYLLLISSMLMSKIVYLRVLAIASGATGVLYFTVFLGDRVASVWEGLFIAANLFQLILTAYRDRMSRFTPDEMVFRTMAVPGLSPSEAHKLLKLASVVEATGGTEITQEGKPVSALAFILDGDVSIRLGEKEIARCGETDFVGEISVTSGGEATASAVAATPVRYLAFEAEPLRQFLRRDHRIAQELELAFRSGLREKLVRANQALAAN